MYSVRPHPSQSFRSSLTAFESQPTYSALSQTLLLEAATLAVALEQVGPHAHEATREIHRIVWTYPTQLFFWYTSETPMRKSTKRVVKSARKRVKSARTAVKTARKRAKSAGSRVASTVRHIVGMPPPIVTIPAIVPHTTPHDPSPPKIGPRSTLSSPHAFADDVMTRMTHARWNLIR